MNNPLCKYCGEKMHIAKVEYADIWYKCNCDGYLKADQLEEEIVMLQAELMKKEMKLREHIKNSLYERSIRDLETQIKEFKKKFKE